MIAATFKNYVRPVFNNGQRPTVNNYGDVHFISFLAAVWARFAYLWDYPFMESYKKIMGPVISPEILAQFNAGMRSGDIDILKDDENLFQLGNQPKVQTYSYNNKLYIDFIKEGMPQKINAIHKEMKGNEDINTSLSPTKDQVKFISIAWSNYGEIFVVADKRMPNTILLLFRGTYSYKTWSLYSKPTSIVPLTVCNDKTFLYGIFKPTSEMIHTIIESISYLARDFLGATQPNSVRIFTTGHSLGGAMTTIFSYLWVSSVKKTPPYQNYPYNVLRDDIVCVSLGAPRVFGKKVAREFCDFTLQKKILYIRITTHGDPIPALPAVGFEHACSDNEENRKKISEDCNSNFRARPFPYVDYKAPLDCKNEKTRIHAPNVVSHGFYLDIMYLKGLDLMHVWQSILINREILRLRDGSTVCRLVESDLYEAKVIFFNVNQARDKPDNQDIQFDKSLEGSNNSKQAEIELTNLSQGQPSPMQGGFISFSNMFKPKVSAPLAPSQPPSFEMSNLQKPSLATPRSLVTPAVSSPANLTRKATPSAAFGQPPRSIEMRTLSSQPIQSAAVPQQPSNIGMVQNKPTPYVPSRSMFKIGGYVKEDVRMTQTAFKKLIDDMKPLMDLKGDITKEKFSPITPDVRYPDNDKEYTDTPLMNPFSNVIMPDLSCPPVTSTGGLRKRRTHTTISKKRTRRHFNNKGQSMRRRHKKTLQRKRTYSKRR